MLFVPTGKSLGSGGRVLGSGGHHHHHGLKGGAGGAGGGLAGPSQNFYCRLRMYNGLKGGRFSVKERKTIYNPFKLAVCFKVRTIKGRGGKSEFVRLIVSVSLSVRQFIGRHLFFIFTDDSFLSSRFGAGLCPTLGGLILVDTFRNWPTQLDRELQSVSNFIVVFS